MTKSTSSRTLVCWTTPKCASLRGKGARCASLRGKSVKCASFRGNFWNVLLFAGRFRNVLVFAARNETASLRRKRRLYSHTTCKYYLFKYRIDTFYLTPTLFLTFGVVHRDSWRVSIINNIYKSQIFAILIDLSRRTSLNFGQVSISRELLHQFWWSYFLFKLSRRDEYDADIKCGIY